MANEKKTADIDRYFEAYYNDIHVVDEYIRLGKPYTFDKFVADFNSGKYIFGFISAHTSKTVITHKNGMVVDYGIGKCVSGDAIPTARESSVRCTALGKSINRSGYEIVTENLGAYRELIVTDFDFEHSLMVKHPTSLSGRETDYQVLVGLLAGLAVEFQQERYIVAMKDMVVEFWGYGTQEEDKRYSNGKLAGKEKNHCKTVELHSFKTEYWQAGSVTNADNLVGKVYGDRVVYFNKHSNKPVYWGYKTKTGVGVPYNQSAKGFVEPLRVFKPIF